MFSVKGWDDTGDIGHNTSIAHTDTHTDTWDPLGQEMVLIDASPSLGLAESQLGLR